MRAREFIGEEYVHRVQVDIKNLARNMAAARFASEHGQGLNYTDSLIYLGLLGDPGLEIALKPKAIGAYYQKKHRQEKGDDQIHQAFKTTSPTATTMGIYGWGVHPERDRARNNLSQQQYDLYRDKDVEYDLFVSVENGENLEDLATAQPNTIANLAHELRHRALQLAKFIPGLKGQLPYNRIMDNTGHVSDPTSIYYMKAVTARSGPSHNMYVEHAMMYSIERQYTKGFLGLYDSLEQIRAYQDLYRETESFIRSWLNRNQNNHRAWQDLVKYIDQKTPGTNTVRIDQDNQGKPVIVNREPATTPTSVDNKSSNKLTVPAPNNTTPIRQTPGIVPPGSPWSRPEGPSSSTTTPITTSSPSIVQQRPPLPINPNDGAVGQALAQLGVSIQNRRDQNFVNSMLGAGYQAGSAAANLALLKKLQQSKG